MVDEGRAVRTISLYLDGRHIDNVIYQLAGTPCQEVIQNRTCVYPRNVFEAYPSDRLKADFGADGPFEMLFSDVVLPGSMNGVAVAAAAREAYPEIKVLYCSGYTQDAIAQDAMTDPDLHLLHKLYRTEMFLSRVRELLDG